MTHGPEWTTNFNIELDNLIFRCLAEYGFGPGISDGGDVPDEIEAAQNDLVLAVAEFLAGKTTSHKHQKPENHQ